MTLKGIGAIFSAVVKELVKRGETVDSMRKKIAGYPISPSLKRKLNDELSNYAKHEAQASL